MALVKDFVNVIVNLEAIGQTQFIPTIPDVDITAAIWQPGTASTHAAFLSGTFTTTGSPSELSFIDNSNVTYSGVADATIAKDVAIGGRTAFEFSVASSDAVGTDQNIFIEYKLDDSNRVGFQFFPSMGMVRAYQVVANVRTNVGDAIVYDTDTEVLIVFDSTQPTGVGIAIVIGNTIHTRPTDLVVDVDATLVQNLGFETLSGSHAASVFLNNGNIPFLYIIPSGHYPMGEVIAPGGDGVLPDNQGANSGLRLFDNIVEDASLTSGTLSLDANKDLVFAAALGSTIRRTGTRLSSSYYFEFTPDAAITAGQTFIVMGRVNADGTQGGNANELCFEYDSGTRLMRIGTVTESATEFSFVDSFTSSGVSSTSDTYRVSLQLTFIDAASSSITYTIKNITSGGTESQVNLASNLVHQEQSYSLILGTTQGTTQTGTQTLNLGQFALVGTVPDGVSPPAWVASVPYEVDDTDTDGRASASKGLVSVQGVQDIFTGAGVDSIRIGTDSGATSQGNSSVAIGTTAGQTSQGIQTVAIGHLAAQTSQSESAVAIGDSAGKATQGKSAVAVGDNAGATSQGIQSVAVGNGAGFDTQGSSSVAVGFASGRNNQGAGAVAVGNSAGNTSQGGSAVAIGVNAGNTSQSTNSVAVGTTAGQTSQGVSSVSVGQNAGNSMQGARAVAVGVNAGNSSQGADAVAIGNSAGQSGQEANGVHLKTPDFDFEFVPSTNTLSISNAAADLVLLVNGGAIPTLNRTSTQLNALADAINTTGKTTGAMVYNTTTGTPVWASGPLAADTWNDATGAVVNTPV